MEETEIVIVRSNMSKVIKRHGFNMASAAPTALNIAVLKMLDVACERATMNNRKTVFPQDI